MGNDSPRHKNISVEQIAALESKGFVHAGFDQKRNREVFYPELQTGETLNPKKLACEFVNTTKWELRIAHLETDKLIPFPSGAIVYLPQGHEGYQVQHRDGSPFCDAILINYGDAMHKGNKKPSPPEPTIKAYRRSGN